MVLTNKPVYTHIVRENQIITVKGKKYRAISIIDHPDISNICYGCAFSDNQFDIDIDTIKCNLPDSVPKCYSDDGELEDKTYIFVPTQPYNPMDLRIGKEVCEMLMHHVMHKLTSVYYPDGYDGALFEHYEPAVCLYCSTCKVPLFCRSVLNGEEVK